MNRPKIVIVDDDPYLLALLSRELSSAFEPLPFNTFEDAIERLGAGSGVCAVISDYDLGPGPSGADVLRFSRDEVPTRVRFLVTGSPMVSAAATSVAHRIFGKPWRRGSLSHALLEELGCETTTACSD